MASEKLVHDKKKFRNVRSYLSEFCRNSTIHGLKFFGENDRSILERVWWVVFIGLSLYMVTNLIATTHKKWVNSPVIVSFATSETPIYEIPFPAVTICPLVKIDPKKFNASESSRNNQYDSLVDASLVCPQLFWNYENIRFVETVSDDALKFLLNISLDSEDIVAGCYSTSEVCEDKRYPLFTPVLTSGGVCYTYNFFDRDDLYTDLADLSYLDNIKHRPRSSWSVDHGYRKKIGINTYPRRSILTGSRGGLELILSSLRQDFNNDCENTLNGYKVILHHPGKVPRYDERDILVPLNAFVSIGIKPNMITTSKELKNYKSKDRKCFLEKERQLEFFKTYDQQNCLEECLSHYALKKCDCVGFYMPRRNNTPICGPLNYDCLNEAHSEFVIRDSEFELMTESRVKSFDDVPAGKPIKRVSKPNCNCLPSCYSLTYDTETSQMNWDWYSYGKLKFYYNETTYGLSRLTIFYKDLQFMSSERRELYGDSEFWANCGGLLGLFTGFSILSAAELFVLCNFKVILQR